MALFGFGKNKSKKARRDPRDSEKDAGAREYEARYQQRLAERRESQGDVEGAREARDAADAARRPPPRR